MDIYAVGTTIMKMITDLTVWQSIGFKLNAIKMFSINNTYGEMIKYFATGITKAFEPFPQFKDYLPLVIAITRPNPDDRPDIEGCIEFFNKIGEI